MAQLFRARRTPTQPKHPPAQTPIPPSPIRLARRLPMLVTTLSTVLLSMLVGCQPQSNHAAPDTASPASDPSPPNPSPQNESTSSSDLTLTPTDAAGLQAWVAQQTGKVVLVDCWALWCLHCLEEMPKVVAWEEEWRDQGLVVASLNFDPPGDLDQRREAAAHLAQLAARFTPFQSSVSPGSKAMEDFGIDAGLPHYRVYDRRGNQVGTFDDAGPELEAQLRELLETKAP